MTTDVKHTMEFSWNPDAFWGMCGPEYEATIRPSDLVSLFGYPIDDGDAESLGSYVFSSPSGEVAIIYFRAYDFSSLLLKIFKRRFWRSTKTFDLTIGAENTKNATLFCEWLSAKVNMSYRPR